MHRCVPRKCLVHIWDGHKYHLNDCCVLPFHGNRSISWESVRMRHRHCLLKHSLDRQTLTQNHCHVRFHHAAGNTRLDDHDETNRTTKGGTMTFLEVLGIITVIMTITYGAIWFKLIPWVEKPKGPVEFLAYPPRLPGDIFGMIVFGMISRDWLHVLFLLPLLLLSLVPALVVMVIGVVSLFLIIIFWFTIDFVSYYGVVFIDWVARAWSSWRK